MTTIEILNERVAGLEKQIALLLADKDATDIPDKKKNNKKKTNNSTTDDALVKKKRTSGYILYSNAHRDSVRDSLTTDDEKPKNTDIMKRLAENWKALNDDERNLWNTKAKED
tara:strand:+ start:264 stop:602 length:339 start_codon:yes stop_codon:yes gene_type:complete